MRNFFITSNWMIHSRHVSLSARVTQRFYINVYILDICGQYTRPHSDDGTHSLLF